MQDPPTVDAATRHKQALAAHYNQTWSSWDAVYEGVHGCQDTSFDVPRRMATVVAMLDAYAGNRTLHVLDAGCGAGVLLEAVLKRGHRAAGIDISSNMVKAARIRTSTFQDQGVSCMEADLAQLPFEDGVFDVVLCIGVLSHQQDDVPALREIQRVLVPGGRCFLTLPNLFKLQNMVDPRAYIKYANRWMRARCRAPNRAAIHPDAFIRGDAFSVKKYSYRKALGIGRESGLRLTDIQPCGYGPFSRRGHRVPARQKAHARAERLEARARRIPFRFLRALPNSWVIALEKPPADPMDNRKPNETPS